MSPIVFLLEIGLLSTALCLLHSIRDKVGYAPFFVVVGLLEVFLFVSGKGDTRIMVSMFSGSTHLSTPLFLSLLLASMVMVYILDGTREARRFMLAMLVIYLFHGAVDVLLDLHGTHPPDGFPDLAGSTLLDYSNWVRFSSFVAISADFIGIVIVYQFLRNRMSWAPLGVPVFLALVFAMATDAVVYSAVNGTIVGPQGLRILEKLQAGFAAGFPLAVYLQIQLALRGTGEARTLLDRSSLEILDLRARVEEAENLLKEQRQQYLYIKQTFSKYVPPSVVETILKDPSKVSLGGEVRDVTILFADVRGYSTLAEVVPPHELIDMLNQYLAEMSAVIFEHHGMINEFEGDGILAVFGAPLALEDHAKWAVDAGCQMLEAVEKLNQVWEENGVLDSWRRAGLERLAIRIGIHSGRVVAGNIGTETRMKYAVIGDTVNTAARIEGLNKELGTSLLFSRLTRTQLPAEQSYCAMGQHRVKGKNTLIEVYTVNQ